MCIEGTIYKAVQENYNVVGQVILFPFCRQGTEALKDK